MVVSRITLLSSIFVLIFVITVTQTAPTQTQPEKPKSNVAGLKHAPVQTFAESRMRRGKRQVMIEETPQDEEEMIREELEGLSDEQLAMLADMVQSEIDNYARELEEPPVVEYEIVEVPDQLLEPYPRDRRSVVEMDDGDEMVEDPEEAVQELIVVPEEAIEEALREQEDDLELRMRIAEMAEILNERATRRSRRGF